MFTQLHLFIELGAIHQTTLSKRRNEREENVKRMESEHARSEEVHAKFVQSSLKPLGQWTRPNEQRKPY